MKSSFFSFKFVVELYTKNKKLKNLFKEEWESELIEKHGSMAGRGQCEPYVLHLKLISSVVRSVIINDNSRHEWELSLTPVTSVLSALV